MGVPPLNILNALNTCSPWPILFRLPTPLDALMLGVWSEVGDYRDRQGQSLMESPRLCPYWSPRNAPLSPSSSSATIEWSRGKSLDNQRPGNSLLGSNVNYNHYYCRLLARCAPPHTPNTELFFIFDPNRQAIITITGLFITFQPRYASPRFDKRNEAR